MERELARAMEAIELIDLTTLFEEYPAFELFGPTVDRIIIYVVLNWMADGEDAFELSVVFATKAGRTRLAIAIYAWTNNDDFGWVGGGSCPT